MASLWNLFVAERHVLQSPLDAEECVRRLHEQVELNRVDKRPGETVVGSVYGRRFTLWTRTPPVYGMGLRNSFRTVARGRLRELSNGTRISVRMSMHPLMWAFMALFALIPAFSAIPSPEVLRTPAGIVQALPGIWHSYVAYAIWLFVVICVYGFARLLSIGEAHILLTFVAKTLLASETAE